MIINDMHTKFKYTDIYICIFMEKKVTEATTFD